MRLLRSLALLLLILPTSAGAFTLVKNGKPGCVIVIAENPSENARIAAQELQTYVEKISGARLEIRADSENVTGPKVLVGRSRLTDAIAGLVIPSGLTEAFREEGYVIRSAGDMLVLAGNDATAADLPVSIRPGQQSAVVGKSIYLGTRYAVNDLLKRLGVRWFMPGEYGEFVPKATTLQVSALHVTERPDFPMRSFWTCGDFDLRRATERELWMVRNRMNPRSCDWFGVPVDSSLPTYLPMDKVKEHPEWFALQRDGTRSERLPCMMDEMRRNDPKYAGQPRLLDEIMNVIGEDVRAGKRVSAFSPDDGCPTCECQLCRSMSIRYSDGFTVDTHGAELGTPGDPIPGYLTGQEYFYFVNQVLEATAKKYPGHLIATNGYANRYVPPENIPDFNRHKNLTIMFADINGCTIHRLNDPKCWQSHEEYNLLKQWCKISDKVWIYGYNYTMLVSKDTLNPMERRLKDNIRMIKEAGSVGFLDQEWADMAQLGLPTYIARMALEWDVKADVDAILADFYRKWFGPAAGPMSDYYKRLEVAFDTAPYHAHEDCILSEIYTPKLMARLADDIARAEAEAVTDADKLHVRVERLQFDHLQMYVDSLKAKNDLRFSDAAKLMEKMIANRAEMHGISEYYGWSPTPYGMEWERDRMKRLAAKKVMCPLPQTARFCTDKHDLGRTERWMEPDYDDSKWQICNTTVGWQNQSLKDNDGLPTMSKDGHCYKGFAWYRFDVDAPSIPQGKQIRIFCPAITNQGWVFVNGKYAGRNNYQQGWFRPQELDVDVTPYLKPGKNAIVVRVLALDEYFGANGLYERAFLYSR